MTFDVAIVFIAAGIVVGLLCLTALILYEGGFFGAGWVLKRSNVFFFAVDHRTIYQWKLASIRLIVSMRLRTLRRPTTFVMFRCMSDRNSMETLHESRKHLIMDDVAFE